jgi:hypothetical protein
MSGLPEALDIRVGDVVKASHKFWPEGSYIYGPVGDDQRLCGFVMHPMVGALWTVEVISRVPRPFYVNADRDPVPGDVVSYLNKWTGESAGPFLHATSTEWAGREAGGRSTPWLRLPGLARDTGPLYAAGRVVLLVDGETGQVVP